MSTTATVETLTASVHVLMVGSNRQVTLSVARQLDQVRYSELEPMGRVRLTNRDQGFDIIGRERASGALVISGWPAHVHEEAQALPLIVLAGLR